MSVMHAAVCGFVSCGPNLIVVRTIVGQAQPVALFLDAQQDSSIVATLAGDDTIFVATKNQKTHAVALRRLEAWFGDKRER
jgi:transcriptional regulator of arginine metabolism